MNNVKLCEASAILQQYLTNLRIGKYIKVTYRRTGRMGCAGPTLKSNQ